MHNSSFDVVSIERPSNVIVNLVVDEWNAERELVSSHFVRFCSRVPAVRALSLLDHVGGGIRCLPAWLPPRWWSQ